MVFLELQKIEKKMDGKYLSFYNLHYKNRLGNEKIYELVSHNHSIEFGEDLYNQQAEAVVMIVLDRLHDHILLNKEFRMGVNSYVYNTPCGLVENGESYLDAVTRELKEETGLDLIRVVTVMGPSYSSVGISNEKTICVICEAEGVLGGNPEPDEEIECAWYSKEAIRRMLEDCRHGTGLLMGARSQMFCYMWCMGL